MTHREIENPFLKMEGYNCFGCGPSNHLGLRMKFFVDAENDEVFSLVTPNKEHCGFPGVLHGGIQATLLDEIAFWAIWEKIGKPALTARMEIELRKPVTMPAEVEVRGRVIETKKRIARVETWLSLEGQVKARAKIVYYLFDPAKLHSISTSDFS